MTQMEMFLTGLRALRNVLASAVDQIDVILDLAQQPSNNSGNAPLDECPHSPGQRIPKVSMGHPTRFYCTACKQDVEG